MTGQYELYRVVNDNMRAQGFFEGQVLLVDTQVAVKSGDRVVACISDRHFCGIYKDRFNGHRLEMLDPDKLLLPLRDLDQVVGVVVGSFDG